MTYFADESLLFTATTTEQATGRTVDGAATYIKVVKLVSTLSTGTTSTAHGITGLSKIIRCQASVLRPTNIRGTEILIMPFGYSSAPFHCSIDFDATNMNIRVGSGWTGTNNVLSNPLAIIEYTK